MIKKHSAFSDLLMINALKIENAKLRHVIQELRWALLGLALGSDGRDLEGIEVLFDILDSKERKK